MVARLAAAPIDDRWCTTPFLLAHRAVESLLMVLFPDGNARRAIGFHQISRIPDDTLAWYLWTDDRPGAYQVELAESALADPAPAATRADLVVRYFPALDEPAYATLSPTERRLRRSDVFDGTGTPRERHRAELDPGLFVCGVLRLAADDRFHLLALQVMAQTEWREHVQRPDGAHLVRHLAGWDLTFPLFDKLVLAEAYVHRAVPVLARAGRMPGSGWVREPFGATRHQPEPDVEGRTCTVVLPVSRPGGPRYATDEDPPAERPGREALAPFHALMLPEEVIAETHTPPTTRPETSTGWLQPAWWQAHRWTFAADAHVCHHCFAEEEPGHDH